MQLLRNYKTWLTGLLFLLVTSLAMGQGKLDIAVGAGIPELVNLGLRYQSGQNQWGFNGGIVPGSENEVFSVGTDYYYHFEGSSKYSSRRPWYVKAGLNYFHDESSYERNTYLLLLPRIGRDLNFSHRFGVALEGGLLLNLSHTEVDIRSRPSDCMICGGGIFPDIGPSLGLNLFYRL